MLIKTQTIKISNSKFVGYLYNISNIEEINIILKEIQKKHKKATHICSAYKFNDEYKFKTDGEVGSIGKLLFQSLNIKNLNSHLIVIVRYFGGTKLGIGGVQRAFREIARIVSN